MSKHNEHSSYREKLIEHLFASELLKLSWLDHECGLEIAKPEVDNSGYDIIAECYGIIRHIQLKASHISSSTTQQKVHVKLADKPSGCMVWVVFDEATLTLDHFLFYGDKAGEPLPSLDSLKVAKHSKGNKDGIKAERPNIRVINKGQFKTVKSVGELFNLLFCNEPPNLEGEAFSPQNLIPADHDNEFKKLHRIEKWSNKPWQKNSQLIKAFLELNSVQTNITLDQLFDHCIKSYGGALNEWKNNFNSMKSDHSNSHGKVFVTVGSEVQMYDEVRKEINKFTW